MLAIPIANTNDEGLDHTFCCNGGGPINNILHDHQSHHNINIIIINNNINNVLLRWLPVVPI